MNNFFWLIFAHFIGDVAFQKYWQSENKGKLWFVMLSHTFIWTGCICIALEYLGLFAMWKVVFLIAGHWVMDKWKGTKPRTPESWKYIYPDQAWHFIQCWIVYKF